MNTKTVVLVLALIVALVLGYFAFANRATAPAPEAVTTPQEEGAAVVDSVPTVRYTDTGFTPKTAQVAVGTTVRFVNESSKRMWVGVDDHPTHTKYDGTSKDEHCPSETVFDQCAAVEAGGVYEFTFTKAGTWGYHNHAGANDTGTIIVN